MKTLLYNFDLEPHFYIVKLGFTGIYIIFLVLLRYMDCGRSLRVPAICVSGMNMKNIRFFFLSENFLNLVKIFNIFE